MREGLGTQPGGAARDNLVAIPERVQTQPHAQGSSAGPARFWCWFWCRDSRVGLRNYAFITALPLGRMFSMVVVVYYYSTYYKAVR